jgi:hypothetical protein
MTELDLDTLLADLKQKRDELRVQMNLASKDMEDEWGEFEGKWSEFMRKADLEATGKGLSESTEKLGEEIKLGYQRILAALKD